MGEHAVEAVRGRRAGWTAGLVVRAEHEVIDHQLRAPVEQLLQAPRTRSALEGVRLLDRHPGKLPALPGELIALPAVLLFAREQLGARRAPFFPGTDPVLIHRGSPPVQVSARP